MKNKIYKAFSIALSFSLSGCMGIYEGGFECPAGVGVGCKSISDVNTMVNQGDIPKALAEQPITTKAEIWYAPCSSAQCAVSSIQKESTANSDQAYPPPKEQRKGAALDAKSI